MGEQREPWLESRDVNTPNDDEDVGLGGSSTAVLWENGQEAITPPPRRRLRSWAAVLVLLALSFGLFLTYGRDGLELRNSPSSAADEPLVARVGDETITREEVVRAVAVARALYRATQGIAPGEIDETSVVNQLADQALLLQAAEAAGISITEDEVTTYIRQLTQARKLTEETLARVLKEEGATMEDLREVIRRAMIADRFTREVITVDVPPGKAKEAIDRWLKERRARVGVEIQPAAMSKPVTNREEPIVGALAPDFTLPNLAGDEITLSDLRGQAVLINFWATWCPPCRLEMPAIEQTYRKYREQGFVVLAVDLEEPKDRVQGFVDELGLTFPVLLDESGTVSRRYRVLAIPTSFFVNRQGVIIAIWRGAMSAEVIERYTLRALSDAKAPENAVPEPSDRQQVHWHARLRIVRNGQEEPLPNLERGQFIDIHQPDLTLGAALEQMGVEYGPNCVLECPGNPANGELIVRVNGRITRNFATYTLRDGDEILMELR